MYETQCLAHTRYLTRLWKEIYQKERMEGDREKTGQVREGKGRVEAMDLGAVHRWRGARAKLGTQVNPCSCPGPLQCNPSRCQIWLFSSFGYLSGTWRAHTKGIRAHKTCVLSSENLKSS